VDTEPAEVDWTEHFVGALGLELWVEDDLTHGRAELRPEMLGAASGLPRLGVLATMVDIVAGTPPTGSLNPTVDLRVWLLSRPPTSGPVLLRAQPVKFGRRLYVADTILHTGDPERPFARSTCTFMNERIAEFGTMTSSLATDPLRTGSFDALLGARVLADGSLEMDVHAAVSNGPGGTIQGGAQALLGELAAEHALADRGLFTAVDLEIRFLNRIRGGGVTAAPELDDGDLGIVGARVPVVESEPGGRMASLVSLVCRAF
jgi:acyl-coenzyme A thioesterase PaaI-like protein